MDKATAEQAWNEIHGTFLDDMLNIAQKKQFVMSILQGQLANPPPANPQGDGQGFLFRSIDVTLDEYYTRRMRTKPTQRRLVDLEFIGRIQRMNEPWMPTTEAARVPPEAGEAEVRNVIEFPSSPAYNIDNRPLTWLYTHCLSLGMKTKSNPPEGYPTAELDIALFTADLLARAEKTEQAARVPPENHITKVARLASMLPTSEEADNTASEIINQFEKGAGKPLHVPDVTPSKPAEPLPDRLLEAAKAVLAWYNGERGAMGLNARLEAMSYEIRTIEAQGKGEG